MHHLRKLCEFVGMASEVLELLASAVAPVVVHPLLCSLSPSAVDPPVSASLGCLIGVV